MFTEVFMHSPNVEMLFESGFKRIQVFESKDGSVWMDVFKCYPVNKRSRYNLGKNR